MFTQIFQMIACKILSRKLLLSRLVSTSSVYCKDSKDDDDKSRPVPPILPPDKPEEIVPIAPKVIAKNPPIEELTRGRVFDPKTQTYRIAKVPLEKPDAKVPKVTKEAAKQKIEDPAKDALRKHIILAFTARLQDAAQHAKGADGTTPAVGGGEGSDKKDSIPIPRLIRQEPEQTMFCLFPYPWVKAFNEKTGVTGFWTFLFTYGTYLLSKEKIIMEHEYYGALSIALAGYLTVKYIGPHIAQGLDKQIDEYEASFQKQRIDEKDVIEAGIEHEKQLQVSMEEQLALVQAKRENVDLQLEAEYRGRQMEIYKRVKGMLDFQVEYDEIQRRYAQDQMVRWTVEKVHESITDDLDSEYIDSQLAELDALLQQRQAI